MASYGILCQHVPPGFFYFFGWRQRKNPSKILFLLGLRNLILDFKKIF